MAREVQEDFKELISFFKGYNLQQIEFDGKLMEYLSKQHKKYFTYLICIGEFSNLKDNELLPSLSDKQIEFLTESCSDIGNSIFLMVNGAYKPSRMMLRSSIETFMKGYVLDQITDIDTEKSVYKIFDKVKALEFFQIEGNKKLFDSIHNNYKVLCEDIHTATAINMAHITALEYFPSIDIERIEKISDLCFELVLCYLNLLAKKYGKYILAMHHRNKEIVFENIYKDLRREIMGFK